MQLIMRRPEIHNFIAISCPVNKYDFTFLSQCPISGFVIQAVLRTFEGFRAHKNSVKFSWIPAITVLN